MVLYNLNYSKKQKVGLAKIHLALCAAALGSFPLWLYLVSPLPSLSSAAASPDKAPLFILVRLQKCIWLGCLISSFRAFEAVLQLPCHLSFPPPPSGVQWGKCSDAVSILPSAQHSHSVPLCRKHPCNTKACIQELSKGFSEVITNQAEKYQREMCNIQEKLCLFQAAGALPTRRSNCWNANPELQRTACKIFTVKHAQLKCWLMGEVNPAAALEWGARGWFQEGWSWNAPSVCFCVI